MSAIDQALSAIDRVAEEGDLSPERPSDVLELESLTSPVLLPDGRRIYPPRLHGEPIDELACALIDTDRPAESTFLRLIGPPGSGNEPGRPCDCLSALAGARPGRRGPSRRPVLRVRRDHRRPVQRRVPVPPRVRPR